MTGKSVAVLSSGRRCRCFSCSPGANSRLKQCPCLPLHCCSRNVGGMNAFDPVITCYRKAVAAMRALPGKQPAQLTYQAAIHGTLAGRHKMHGNTCQHGNYFSGRAQMYLYVFERICRRMACDDCFALPYWTTIPHRSASFRQCSAILRAIFCSQRNPAMNSGAGSLPAWAVDYSAGLAQNNFSSGSSSLESLPHNVVHVLWEGGWLVPTAAQDPIFYLHHCNMDRLWDLWLAEVVAALILC